MNLWQEMNLRYTTPAGNKCIVGRKSAPTILVRRIYCYWLELNLCHAKPWMYAMHVSRKLIPATLMKIKVTIYN